MRAPAPRPWPFSRLHDPAPICRPPHARRALVAFRPQYHLCPRGRPMNTLPPLLETYEEARLLLEAKGWGVTKAAEHLAEMPEMAPFHISHTKFSRKTTLGADEPIEPEVAAAVEGLKTWPGYERKTDIVTKGLLARRGARPLPASLKLGQRAFRFLRQVADRFGRAFWTRIAITAASGALVAVLVAPLLAGATPPGPRMPISAGAGPKGSAVSFDPRSLIDPPVSWGEKPL